jgi:hypothetical protein
MSRANLLLPDDRLGPDLLGWRQFARMRCRSQVPPDSTSDRSATASVDDQEAPRRAMLLILDERSGASTDGWARQSAAVSKRAADSHVFQDDRFDRAAFRVDNQA